MAKYRIEDQETGKIFTIEGPDDAAPEELQQAAHEHVSSKVDEYDLTGSLGEGINLGFKGIKQVFGAETPESIAKYKESIRRENPANETLQKIGEMVPGALSGVLSTIPVAGAGTAIATRSIPYLSATMRALQPIIEGATSGAVSSGVMPSTKEGGQLDQALTGALIGGAIPSVTTPLSGAVSFIKQMLTKGGQNERAANKLVELLGKERGFSTLRTAESAAPDPIIGTEHTIPALTNDLDLMAIQKGLRNEFPAEYIGHEQINEALRRKFLSSKVPDDFEIAAALQNRDDIALPMKRALTGEPDIEALNSELGIRQGASLPGTDEYKTISFVKKLTEGDTKLNDLQKLIAARDQIKRSLDNPSTLIESATPDQAVAMQQLDLIDGELDRVTSGGWSNYLRKYSDMSEPVNEARAMRQIGDKLEEVPNLTARNVTAALRKYQDSSFGPNLSASTQQDMERLVDDLAMQERPLVIKATGSDTQMNQRLHALSALEGPLLGFRNPLLGALRGMQVLGQSGTKRALKDLLIDPEHYAQYMSKALKERFVGKPNLRRALTTLKYDPLAQYLSQEGEQ